MKRIIALFLTTICWSSYSLAGLITSDADPALSGATVDDFSSYSLGTPGSVSDGFFTMTDNADPTLTVTDGYDGLYGAVGRSVVSWGSSGISIDFAGAISAFGVHIGGSDANWAVEAISMLGGSLGSATVTHDVNGFFLGWADANIGSIVLTPVSADDVLFDNLQYVEAEAVPAPATLALFGLGLAGLGWSRRKKA